MDTSKSQLSTGTKTTASGVNAITDALSFFKSLSSGDRAVTAQAVAPETNAALSQNDAARRQAASMGTARGGGTAAGNQTAEEKTMATIDNLLFGARPAAAGEVAKIGGELARVGETETNQALGFARLGEEAAGTMTDAAIKSRKDSFAINQDIVGQVTDAIGAVLAAFG